MVILIWHIFWGLSQSEKLSEINPPFTALWWLPLWLNGSERNSSKSKAGWKTFERKLLFSISCCSPVIFWGKIHIFGFPLNHKLFLFPCVSISNSGYHCNLNPGHALGIWFCGCRLFRKRVVSCKSVFYK